VADTGGAVEALGRAVLTGKMCVLPLVLPLTFHSLHSLHTHTTRSTHIPCVVCVEAALCGLCVWRTVLCVEALGRAPCAP
jgi:hypothetical protein